MSLLYCDEALLRALPGATCAVVTVFPVIVSTNVTVLSDVVYPNTYLSPLRKLYLNNPSKLVTGFH